MPSIKMTIELDETFLYDVLTTIVESGSIGYWAMFSEINREVDTQNVISFTIEDKQWHEEHGLHRCGVVCADDEPEFKHEQFDIDHVALGIQRILGTCDDDIHVGVTQYIADYISRGVREMDAGDIDSEACDVIVQAAVLGKLIYG